MNKTNQQSTDSRQQATPYASTHDYLSDYWALLALRLHREVLLARLLRGPSVNESFLGLFLSEPEVDQALAALHGVTLPHSDQAIDLEAAILARDAAIAARVAATTALLRPIQLTRQFDLSSLALELVLLLLAPEVDPRFGRVYAYLQDDVSRRCLTPALALRLLPRSHETAVRALFTAASPLVFERLLHIGAGEGESFLPLIDRSLKLDDRIVDYLLEQDALDPQLMEYAYWMQADGCLEDLAVPAPTRQALRHLASLWRPPAWQAPAAAPPALFCGRPGSGRRAAAAAVAHALGERALLVVEAPRLAYLPEDRVAACWRAAVREARLYGALLHLAEAEALSETARAAVWAHWPGSVILSADQPWTLPSYVSAPVIVHFPLPDVPLRRQLWAARLNGQVAQTPSGDTQTPSGDTPAELAGRFRLTPGQIAQAAIAARQRAWLRDGPHAHPTRQDWFEGARQQSNPALNKLAVKIVSAYEWDDLVLPRAQLTQLRAIESQVRHAHTVYEQWGFGRKLALGRGLNVLFSGPSGTGKTMAAGILARSLGLDIYKIDLSAVVSKYVGETEKNLSRIFDEAAAANVVLFFDEADALFGKRSEVRDAHDRYANIEISYLLQKMEEYEGVSILATNFSQNLDEAFTRRMQYVIDFPLPTIEDRQRLWRGMFPAAAPRADDVDFAFLSAQFELSGGNIKNCVLAAAFLAAETDEPIGMAHLIQGVVREMDKLGRPLTRAAFADYYTQARRR